MPKERTDKIWKRKGMLAFDLPTALKSVIRLIQAKILKIDKKQAFFTKQ